MNPIVMHEVGKARQAQILRDARHQHALAEAATGRPSPIARLISRLAQILSTLRRRMPRLLIDRDGLGLRWAKK
jgi:ABC-type transporter Mla subunit MlaD